MEMVKLKMRTIYKAFLSFIGFLILMATIIGILYLFYEKVSEIESDIEVNGSLSINYIDGKKIDVIDKMAIKFSVTNGSDEVSYYEINFSQIRGEGSYKLLYNDEIITNGELKSTDEISTDYISINAHETKLYILEITNNGSTNLNGTLNIRNQKGKVITFADTIINNVSSSNDALTKVGTDISTEDEGLIKSSDDVGISYYFRGNINNNYVDFGGFTWRIVRINGDETVRLVLDGVTDVLASYYTVNNPTFEFEGSNMNSYLETWLNDNLSDYNDYIANTKFCNDISYDDVYNFNAYARIMTNKIPTLNCLGTSFSNNIGLLTIDEVILAGASPNNLNRNYYLSNKEITSAWYTMSGAKGSDSSMNLFMIDASGSIKTDVSGNLYRNVRPVINLIKNIEMIGDGTKENPYKLSNDYKID